MKQHSIITAVLLLAPLGLSNVNAAEEKAAPQTEHSMPGMNMPQQGQGGMQGKGMPQGQGGTHGMGMMNMMGGMSEEQRDQHLRMMQEHMLQMHDLSDKILAAKDPKEKEKLKEQQLQLMKAHKAQMMKMMHGGMKMPNKPETPQTSNMPPKAQ
ncbi:MAG: hypothetical protein ACU837_01385 [Gammaproteobacteria bacterium]